MNPIDLSHTIQTGMQIFPDDPEPRIEPGLLHESDYCHVDRLNLGSHTGTHIDAPFHFLPEGKRIDEIPLARFMGWGVRIPVTGKPPGSAITPAEIEPYLPEIEPGDFAILHTGWDRKWGTPDYLHHPYLSPDCARLLRLHLVSLVGIDALNVDPTHPPDSLGDPSFEAHRILLGREILIVENLCNLTAVPANRGRYLFLPLKLKGSDGSPIRAAFLSD
ncbi:MAG: cyclase family protein [Desulfobacterales bacterium]